LFFAKPYKGVVWLIHIAVSVCSVFYASGAYSEPVFDWAALTQENSGLPQNEVNALARGKDGSLWIGTISGLGHLDKDGHLKTYTKASSQGGLPDNGIRALAQGDDGSLWVGTDTGLAKLDEHGVWQTFTRASTHGGLPNDHILALAIGVGGSMWVGTLGGVALRHGDGPWQTYTKASTQGGLPDDYASGLLFDDASGSLWVATLRGVARLDKEGRWQNYDSSNTKGGLPYDFVDILTSGIDGSLWVGTTSGLARRNKEGNWQTYNLSQPLGGSKGNRFQALALAADGSLWAGTLGGLAHLGKDGRWQTFTKANTQGGLSDDNIRSLAFGEDATLWVGTASGLVRLTINGQWERYGKSSSVGGLPVDRVFAMAASDLDHSLWIGTLGGLVHLNEDGQWQTYTKASTQGELPDDRIEVLALDMDGSLWVGTLGGLARLDKKGQWHNYRITSAPAGPVDQGARVLVPSGKGSLWVGTAGGLAYLDQDGHWQVYTKASTQGGLPDDNINALALDADGTLWVGTELGGLARFDKVHWTTFNTENTGGGLPENSVLALATDGHGSLSVGTLHSLARRDKAGLWRSFTKANTQGGLPHDEVHALVSGKDDALWVGTLGGLARLDQEGHWQTYSKANTFGGLPDDSVNVLTLDADGSLWVGTDSGGIGKFSPPLTRSIRIVDVIGKVGDVTQSEQTVAVEAFDDTYLTSPEMFHFIWALDEIDTPKSVPDNEIQTKSPIHKVVFPHDGRYRLSVTAVDRYGNRSLPEHREFNLKQSGPKTFVDSLLSAWPLIVATATGLLAMGFSVLLLLAHSSARAFALLTDAAWAQWLTWPFFFLRHAPVVQRWVLEPWFQAVRRSTVTEVPFVDPPVSLVPGVCIKGTDLLQRSRESPRIWLHGRSGMGKSSLFTAWSRAYFVAPELFTVNAVTRQYGFLLIAIQMRHFAAIPIPDPNRPESWIIEVVRRTLEQYGFGTSDLGLISAMLRAGHVAVALDGANEVDRDISLATFASQFPRTRMLVTSQGIPPDQAQDQRWELWELPKDIDSQREALLELWLGNKSGATISRRIVNEGLSQIVVSGYDLRLLADLVGSDPEHAKLPRERVGLYRAMLERADKLNGDSLHLAGLKQLAWNMMTSRRRRILQDDEKALGVGTLPALERGGIRFLRSMGSEREFRHDQMRAFLAALWLVEEPPTISALQKMATDAGAFALNRRDQEELWGFVGALLGSDQDVATLWQFASSDPMERAILIAALQVEADRRSVTLVRVAQP
jgi:ligand-binding sensor domain-containing protein